MATNNHKPLPKALLFDVFGTVVDWRKTVIEYLQRHSFETLNSASSSSSSSTITPAVRAKCAQVDWSTFAQEWRSSYYAFTRDQAKRKDKNEPLAFKTVDDHHLESLRLLLDQHGISGLWTEDQVFQVSRIWHRLDGWPDSSRGLTALRNQGFVVCTLSNSNIELLTDMADHADLPWTHILSVEHFGAYKPHPSVYTSACERLGLEPGQCAMVAAHMDDLEAARECGLQTIYIERAQEQSGSIEKVADAKSKGWVDMWVGLGDNSEGGGILQAAKNLEDGKTL